MESRDRVADTMLREEMRKLNAHLPRKRQSLSELLAEETPNVPTVDGNRILMKKTDLQALASLLPEEMRNKVKLPIVMLRRTELGPGAFTLLGDSTEEFAFSRITKNFQGTLEEFRNNQKTPSVFYKTEISELLRRFHSLVVIGFGTQDNPK